MDICIENIRRVSLTAGLKMKGVIKWRGLKSQRPLHVASNLIPSVIQKHFYSTSHATSLYVKVNK